MSSRDKEQARLAALRNRVDREMPNFMAGYKRSPTMQMELLDAIKRAMEAHPEQRLGQIMANYGVAQFDLFNVYDEPMLSAFRAAAADSGQEGVRSDGADCQEIARRADVRARFIDSIAQSVNASDGRSAEYVANVLLVHQPRLLAEAAIVFAEAEVKLLLAEGQVTTDEH